MIDNLDLVIAADTAVAHLAGALGKPVWLLNRHASYWRWSQTGTDSPWYATLRQFRQPASGDWQSVVRSDFLQGKREPLAAPPNPDHRQSVCGCFGAMANDRS